MKLANRTQQLRQIARAPDSAWGSGAKLWRRSRVSSPRWSRNRHQASAWTAEHRPSSTSGAGLQWHWQQYCSRSRSSILAPGSSLKSELSQAWRPPSIWSQVPNLWPAGLKRTTCKRCSCVRAKCVLDYTRGRLPARCLWQFFELQQALCVCRFAGVYQWVRAATRLGMGPPRYGAYDSWPLNDLQQNTCFCLAPCVNARSPADRDCTYSRLAVVEAAFMLVKAFKIYLE